MILLCLCDLSKNIYINDNSKLILVVVLIVLHLRKKQKENFGIFESDDTNKIKDNGSIFYEDPLNNNFIKPSTGQALSDLPYLDNSEKLSMFSKNKCSPTCCPSQYSCDRGCICMNNRQKELLYKHGGNQSIPNCL